MIERDRNDDLRMYVAETAARRAGERALDYFRDADLTRQSKGLQDFVSDADRAVEALISEIILAAFPDDAIVGEEGGTRHGTDEYLWAVDPIDGTTVFLDGLPGWCVSIAVIKGDAVEMGVVHDPCAGEIFTARRGAGAFLNGRPLPKIRSRDISSGMVGIGYSRKADPEAFGSFLTALLENGGNFYRNGSAASMLAQVAAGRLVGCYEPHLSAWDCLAGLLLIEETGGEALDFEMADMLAQGGPVLGAAPGGFDQLLKIIPAR